MSAVPADCQHAPVRHCPNCQAVLGVTPGKFCPDCGQSTRLGVPTVAEFVHEFVNHYVVLEGRLWRTLGMLFFRPGVLTREYSQGRRERYVLPLRLFLTFSIVFFIALKFIQPPLTLSPSPASERSAQLQTGKPVAALSHAERQSLALRNVARNGPYAAFVLLPLFTVFLRLLYAKRGLNFGSHLVFAFHFHAVIFTLFLLALVAQWKPVTALAVALGPVHLWFALHNCYGGRWWLNLIRAGTLTGVHLFIIFIAALIAMQWTA
ncbi:MAG: DUF3667 domain-containing protein [Betaproteobacteria bacterium]|nr:DUF3667 domain-containing protein [Betaproteobacteria bacterium]